MPEKLFFLAVAAISGAIMAIQGSLNSVLGKLVGLWEATFIVHIIGTIILTVVIFGLKLGHENWATLTQAPWYVYLGGLLSIGIVYAVAMSIPKLGVATATTAIIVGQVSTALLVDQFGLFGLARLGINWTQIVGLILLALGARLLLSN